MVGLREENVRRVHPKAASEEMKDENL